MIAAGIDIGNSTTEVMIAKQEHGKTTFLGYGSSQTTGLKGTVDNVAGVLEALQLAQAEAGDCEIERIYINETAPVVSRLSSDIVSQTIIVGSAMIGHNPDTPGGYGLGTGKTVLLSELEHQSGGPYIVVVDPSFSFEEAANQIQHSLDQGVEIAGAIVCRDDGVLIANRLDRNIPIVDEVEHIDKVPIGEMAAVEVAGNAATVQILSNPYGIAGLFGLTPEQTKAITPIARTLIGARSGVVIYSSSGEVKLRKVDAGTITVHGSTQERTAAVADGADRINEIVNGQDDIYDITGQEGTNAGAMFAEVKRMAARRTGLEPEAVKISDIAAVDTVAPIRVTGGIAGEYAMENVVLIASMVKTSRFPMSALAGKIQEKTGISVQISGKEASSALLGALTTPGVSLPVAILDLGGGSTDAAYLDDTGLRYTHTAGAGDMVTTMINLELALEDREMAELIKRYPLAKAESLHILRFEDQTVKFLQEPMPSEFFARTLIVTDEKLIPIRKKGLTMEKISLVRREAKRKVFAANALRALKKVAPEGNIRKIDFVIMVGGSALDFEVPDFINETLAPYQIVAGRGNILGKYAARAAVAVGLILASGGEAD